MLHRNPRIRDFFFTGIIKCFHGYLVIAVPVVLSFLGRLLFCLVRNELPVFDPREARSQTAIIVRGFSCCARFSWCRAPTKLDLIFLSQLETALKVAIFIRGVLHGCETF